MHSWIDASPDRQDTAVARTRASSSVAPARATAVHETAPDVGPAANAPRAGHHFANIAILAPLATNAYRPTVQTKLSVSQPDDPYEREADQVAEKVMRMPEPASSSANGADDGDGGEERLIQTKPVSSMITPLMNNTTRIFSKCVACEAEERAQGDAENNAPDQDKSNMSVEESPTQLKAVQNKRNQTDADGVAPNIENTINRRLGQGRAIPESARSFFEPRFDHDFSKVRIHDDAAANDVAHTLQAQAFTRGHDVFFRAGSYQPHTPGGRQLLAHELTHTVQQGATPPLAAHIPGAKSGDHALQSTISRTPSAQHIIHRRVATATLEGNAEQSDDVTDQVASESDNDPERGRKFTRRVVSEPADRQAPLAANMHAPLPPTQRNSTLNTPDDGNAPGPGAASAPASGRESPPPPEAAIKDASVDEASGSPAPPVKNPSPDATPGDARTTELQQASMALKSATEAALHAAPEGEAAADGQTKGTATDVEPVTEGASEVAATVAQETPTGAKGAAVAANASFETHLAEVNRLRLTPIRFMSGYMAQPGDPQDAMRRNRAMTLAKNFIGNIAQRVAGVVGATEETIARMLATLTDTQAAIDADTENETKALSVDANAARKRTRAQGAYTHKHIEAKSTAVASGAEVAAKGATARADAAHKLAKEEVDKQAKDQRKNIDNRYTLAKIETWQVGLRARSKAHARGARRSEVLLAQRNGESTVLDGPLHDNRLEARAEAAITVSNEYGKSFEASGLEQADKVADSKPEVMAKVSEISGQATTGLRDQLKQINDGIAGFEQDAKQRATNTAKQMCTATSTQVQQSIASLTQIEESKVAQLRTFADTQKQALEHTTGTGIAALANGVTQTVGSLVGSMDEFVATAAATPPPDAEELEPTLAAVEGQTVAATDEMQSQITVAAQASDEGMGAALGKATAALTAQTAQGVEQAAAATQTFTEGTGALRAQASKGFAKFEEGDKKTANDMGKGAEDGFQQAAKGARESFGNLATAVSDNFQKGYTQLFDALWGKENQAKLVADMRKYGDEAAAKVQPRWKKVLKWVVTIVVIIAVIAVTVLTAGALGPVGVVLLGATLGALAGAVTTIAHNLIDGKKWSDGVAKAMIVGAIGGAFGGAGGVIFKNVGSVALKIGLEAGLDVAGGIVGEVTGSLAVGEAIDWTNVVTGALIGAGIGAGLGIGGALKGKFKFKAKVDVPTPNVRPHIEPPAPPAGRFRGAMEKVGILAPRGPTIRPHTGLPEGTGGRPAAETPGVHPKSDARPTKTSIPEGTPPTRPRNPHGNHPEIEDGIVAKQPALAGEHQIKVLRDGRVVRCSNCGELRLQYKSEINANPKLKKRLDDIEALADPKLKAQRAAELELDLTAAKARLDAKKLIGPSRKFSDAELENAYQAYRVRKANIGETPRGRADWKVTRDYWMIDSPMARGNNFNKTAGKKYRYNEVNLETGKRVDSYDPVKGEIISRKATDFDIIDESAFKGYLRELKNKYSPGEVIRSNKYPKLDGKPLTGKQILEVPSTNATAANRANFEALAASEGIQIRYTPE